MEVRAYAKINLTLEVLGRRPDGYHEVRTVLQTIDLWDRIRFTGASRLELECSVPELAGEDNLVWKAGNALRAYTGYDRGARISLQKHVPAGMGLGGGSSDAAAAILALNNLWELGLSLETLESIAGSLGADVPFFVRGGGTALGEERGDVMAALPALPEQWLVLVCPPAGAGAEYGKTARLYAMMGREHYTDGGATRSLVETLGNGEVSSEHLFNAFEPVAARAFEGFQRAKGDLLESGAAMAHLSGTGPALYAFVSGKNEGERIRDSLKNKGLGAYCIRTIQPIWDLE